MRNEYFRRSKAVKEEIEKAEHEISRLEEEKAGIEALYADEEACNDGAAIVEATARHQQVLERIKALESRWAELSLQDENMKQELDRAMRLLDSG